MENIISMPIYLNILGCKWQQLNCFMRAGDEGMKAGGQAPSCPKFLVFPVLLQKLFGVSPEGPAGTGPL